MASSKEYLDFILKLLSGADDISYRSMMNEYILYYRGKVIGGIYDDRFLIKPTKSAVAMLPTAKLELPYDGAKPMLRIDEKESNEVLQKLLESMFDELPLPTRRSKK